MISVTPAELDWARRVGALRADAPKTDGALNWRHKYLLAYAGDGFLTVTATDNRIHFRTRLPVIGQAEPWAVAIEDWRFEDVRYLPGGRLTISPQGESRLVLTREPSLRIRFPARGLPPREQGPWPDLREETASTGAADASALTTALAHLASPGSGKGGDNLVASGYEDGTLVALGDGGYSYSRGPALPFAWNLRLRDAQFLRAWLKVLVTESSAQPVTLAMSLVRGRTGSQFLRLADVGGRDTILVPTVDRAFPRGPTDRARDVVPDLQVRVPREELLRLARLAAVSPMVRQLVCTISTPAGGALLLTVTGDGTDETGVRAAIEVAAVNPPAATEPVQPFAMSPQSLRDTLQKTDADEVCLTFRPALRWVGISPFASGSDTQGESLIRADSPPRVASPEVADPAPPAVLGSERS